MSPIVLVLAGFAVGLLIGWFIAAQIKSNKTAAKLQAELDELKETHEQYKSSVDRHFVHTSNLVNNLTRSYKEVHQHLATGAQNLCSDDLAQMLQENTTPLISEVIDGERADAVDHPADERQPESDNAVGATAEEQPVSDADASASELTDTPESVPQPVEEPVAAAEPNPAEQGQDEAGKPVAEEAAPTPEDQPAEAIKQKAE